MNRLVVKQRIAGLVLPSIATAAAGPARKIFSRPFNSLLAWSPAKAWATSAAMTATEGSGPIASHGHLLPRRSHLQRHHRDSSSSAAASFHCSAGSMTKTSSAGGGAGNPGYDGSDDLVKWTLDEKTKIGTITLNSPSTYNALTVEMGDVFSNVIENIRYDLTLGKVECNAIVLEGAGKQAFSAGGDFDWLRNLRHNSVHENRDLMLHFYKSFLCVRELPVPIIAALSGPAIGAGAGLALACDMRTSTDKPRILGFNFARVGIHCGMGASHLLKLALGGRCGIMNEILLTGKILSGRECHDLGLVNRVVPFEGNGDKEECGAKQAAYKLATRISHRHAVAVRAMTLTLRQQQNDGLEAALHQEALAQALCYNRNDWGEGVNAIADKRDPVFDAYHEH